jgi:HEAT repeat protein
MPANTPRPRGSRLAVTVAALTLLLSLAAATFHAQTQEPSGPQRVAEDKLQAAIKALSDLDYDTRSAAARTIRRVAAAQAVPALLGAVSEHADAYVRYKAAVLLTAFNDPRTDDVMRESLSTPNDRLRAVAYAYYEHHPEPAMVAPLLAALDRELSEFVRPALVRALAAAGDRPDLQPVLIREAGRGEDFFRSSVIEALGDHKARYAFDTLVRIAQQDGPLVDDAALALGKLRDPRALPILAALQRSAPPAVQPTVATAVCLLGTNCDVHERYLKETLAFADQNAGYQELLRAAAAGLGNLAVAGRDSSIRILLEAGRSSRESTRAPVALALAMAALRNTPLMLSLLESRTGAAPGVDWQETVTLLVDGFDMLEEDLEKERFFAFVRRSYWESAAGSPHRDLMELLIRRLDF